MLIDVFLVWCSELTKKKLLLRSRKSSIMTVMKKGIFTALSRAWLVGPASLFSLCKFSCNTLLLHFYRCLVVARLLLLAEAYTE